MFKILLILLLIAPLNSCKEKENSQDILSFQTKEARQRLSRSDYNNDFYQLVNFYQPQINPLYCGIATSVILLNAFAENQEIPSQKNAEILKPQVLGGGVLEFHSYSQTSFLNAQTDKIKRQSVIDLQAQTRMLNGDVIFDPGLTLLELAEILQKAYDLKVEIIYADKNDEKSVEKFRKNLKKYLADDDHFIVANFHGKALGTNTGGHISPLAVYDKKSDSVLVLDVALHKDKWYFASVKKLYESMNTQDGDKFRGYLIVSK